MYTAQHMFIDCTPAQFPGRNGEIVRGFSMAFLERVERSQTDGSTRVFYNILNRFVLKPPFDVSAVEMGTPVHLVFGSDGKIVDIRL